MSKTASSVHAKHNIDAESIIFSMFTHDDLKKLCNTKICTPLAFDAMGYPLPGGLYDKSLGPLNAKSDPCATCSQTVTTCPGHFGYIELPLPVVNPIFHKMLATILKLTCLKCFRMQIPHFLKRLFHIQMQLLDSGMITEATEMERIVNAVLSENSAEEELEAETVHRLKKLEKIAKSIGKSDTNVLNKTTESLRNKIIHDILVALRVKKRCIHCKATYVKLQTFKHKIMAIDFDPDKTILDAHEEKPLLKNADMKLITPEESRRLVRKIWANDKELILELVPVLKRLKSEYPTDVFYFDIIPVPPSNVRPVNFVNKTMVIHPQTQIYKAIVQDSMLLRAVIQIIHTDDINDLPAERRAVYESAQGGNAAEKLHHLWQHLQTNVDTLMDRDYGIKTEGQGLKQIIEKKGGIIRMHMMGKRVNYAARSVITPDPNLNIDEIGIPEEFAKQLTYPVPVTSWNVEELRKMVLNGPNVHPGAKMVEFGDGIVYKINENKTQQESLLKRLLTPLDGEKGAFKGVKIVHRHLCNGDILLLNRQPTLHKPSIMSHMARILKGEKTIRLHYANCKAYNADFDGDEMNVHFPQNELARSEGYNLSNVCNQYLVPKDGTPLSGLIQDHMVSGVRLSMRGRFFKRQDYHQLVYQALAHKPGNIMLLQPTILKPEVLWSGKQVLSTVIINIIPQSREPINLTATAKISVKNWINRDARPWLAGGTPLKNNDMSEAEVVIRQGELLVGVLDKTHYGATPYGLIHCMYELYGGQYASKLLSSFAKLFTCFLQQEGFTLGVHDILVLDHADKSRSEIIKESRKIGHRAACKAVDLPLKTPEDVLLIKLEQANATNPKFRSIIDRQYKQELDSYTNDINKVCLPAGLLCKFPENNLQLMVQSGAKGSTVNTMQISCLLGQIELEGKRPPVMISGKSLPSFIPFDVQPRAGGFIDGRFMTGILPQEFFFHCMAGREGLIDTAVKTSRSGYLQRCLIKHLEGLKVEYDLTVRDSDQSVIQFFYGEDGMDISKAQFLKESQLSFLDENSGAIIDEQLLQQLKEVEGYDRLEKRVKTIRKVLKKSNVLKKSRKGSFLQFSGAVRDKIDGSMKIIDSKTGRSEKTQMILDLWQHSTSEIQHSFKRNLSKIVDPTPSDFQPDHYFGSLTDHMETLLNTYVSKSKQPDSKSRSFSDTLRLKAMQSLCCPGEAVGLLAAQSIGEPSTQMTLNTFHFAGRGEMNVTLGIPRLREILMMASSHIKTPSMEIPFLKVDNLEKRAEKLRMSLTKVTTANVLERIDVRVRLVTYPVRQHRYSVRFQFLPYALYKTEYKVTPKFILKHMSTIYFKEMFCAIRKVAKISNSSKLINEDEVVKSTNKGATIEDGSSDEEPEDADEDAKLSSQFKEKTEDQEPDEEEVELSDLDDVEDEEEKAKENEDDKVATDLNVVETYNYAKDYIYDKSNHLWCELTFCLPMTLKNIDLTAILKDVSEKSVIYETGQIKRAITYVKDDVELMLRTDGINIAELVKNYDLLDVNRLYSNDIHKIAHTYGIEAARRVIVKEVKDVFNVYGITVDPRHLLLIADYMTYNGSFEPLSRKGMECNASPLQQMSFESSLTFLKHASLQGKQDLLTSPSSCLMLGKPCTTGTGSFSLLQKLPISC